MTAVRARFTPRAMPPALQEELFVARHHILDEIDGAISAAITTEERGHRLFHGPRGAGKTHLISLAYHRTAKRAESGERVQSAILPEDPWRITSYRRLLTAVAAEVGVEPAGTERELERQLRTAAASRGVIVVFAENLDRILDALGTDGQGQLRSFLQNHSALLIFATTTQLSVDLMDKAKPFYGFFARWELRPFTVGQATEMLKAIATANNQADLALALDTPRARARLRAAETLAGGQPRIWALLANALSLDHLDDTLTALFTQFDDLTAYYQEQLGRLSATQREIVLALVGKDGASNVKTIAEIAEIEEVQTANALRVLAAKGWVGEPASTLTDLVDKRQRFYELNEPLLRIALELKESKGEPVALIVEFLTAWFTPQELEPPDPADPDLATITQYLVAATNHLRDNHARTAYRLLADQSNSQRPRGGVGHFLLSVDRALEQLQHHGDAGLVLGLPTAVRRLIEERLATETVPDIRASVHTAALNTRSAPDVPAWLDQASTLTDLTPFEASAILARWHIQSGDASAGINLMADEALDTHGSEILVELILFSQYEEARDMARRIISRGEHPRVFGNPQVTGEVVGANMFFALILEVALVRRLGGDAEAVRVTEQHLQRLGQHQSSIADRGGAVLRLALAWVLESSGRTAEAQVQRRGAESRVPSEIVDALSGALSSIVPGRTPE